jgi:hypothetical protein
MAPDGAELSRAAPTFSPPDQKQGHNSPTLMPRAGPQCRLEIIFIASEYDDSGQGGQNASTGKFTRVHGFEAWGYMALGCPVRGFLGSWVLGCGVHG